MKKVYKKLSEEDRERGVIFQSTLSVYRTEQQSDVTHEVFEYDSNKNDKIENLLNDSFFNKSHFNFNIVRE